jgi:hypothetical protein
VGRLSGEASTIFVGSQPASTALGILTYYLLATPDTYQKLMAELLPHAPDETNLPSWTALEKIPYLSGVVMEGLRLTYGFSQRLERIPTDEVNLRAAWSPSGLRYWHVGVHYAFGQIRLSRPIPVHTRTLAGFEGATSQRVIRLLSYFLQREQAV